MRGGACIVHGGNGTVAGRGGRGTRPALRILYVSVLAVVAAGGLFTIVDWAGRGGELPGGGVPVAGRVIEEQPGFSGALALVEVAYEAGGKERRARLPVPGSDQNPNDPTYRPGDQIALLVSRTNPERVHQVGWNSDAPTSGIPGWLLVVAAIGIVAPLVLPRALRRLQAAFTALRSQ